jgi:hypothetical protein
MLVRLADCLMMIACTAFLERAEELKVFGAQECVFGRMQLPVAMRPADR